MTSYEFEVAAKNALIQLIQACYGETYGIHEIHLTSLYHILGSKKCTAIDCGDNMRYYEVTYNAPKDEMYVDMYEKRHNIRIPGKELKTEVLE